MCHGHYSGTPQRGHRWNKDTSQIWTLSFVPIVVILYNWIKDSYLGPNGVHSRGSTVYILDVIVIREIVSGYWNC